MLNARVRAVLARLDADLIMSWILTGALILGGPRALSSSSRAPEGAGASFVFALSFLLRFLMAGGGVGGVDISTDGSISSLSIFRFFLGGDVGFFNSGLRGMSVDVLSKAAFAFFAFAFTLASSRRAFRA